MQLRQQDMVEEQQRVELQEQQKLEMLEQQNLAMMEEVAMSMELSTCLPPHLVPTSLTTYSHSLPLLQPPFTPMAHQHSLNIQSCPPSRIGQPFDHLINPLNTIIPNAPPIHSHSLPLLQPPFTPMAHQHHLNPRSCPPSRIGHSPSRIDHPPSHLDHPFDHLNNHLGTNIQHHPPLLLPPPDLLLPPPGPLPHPLDPTLDISLLTMDELIFLNHETLAMQQEVLEHSKEKHQMQQHDQLLGNAMAQKEHQQLQDEQLQQQQLQQQQHQQQLQKEQHIQQQQQQLQQHQYNMQANGHQLDMQEFTNGLENNMPAYISEQTHCIQGYTTEQEYIMQGYTNGHQLAHGRDQQVLGSINGSSSLAFPSLHGAVLASSSSQEPYLKWPRSPSSRCTVPGLLLPPCRPVLASSHSQPGRGSLERLVREAREDQTKQLIQNNILHLTPLPQPYLEPSRSQTDR